MSHTTIITSTDGMKDGKLVREHVTMTLVPTLSHKIWAFLMRSGRPETKTYELDPNTKL